MLKGNLLMNSFDGSAFSAKLCVLCVLSWLNSLRETADQLHLQTRRLASCRVEKIFRRARLQIPRGALRPLRRRAGQGERCVLRKRQAGGPRQWRAGIRRVRVGARDFETSAARL